MVKPVRPENPTVDRYSTGPRRVGNTAGCHADGGCRRTYTVPPVAYEWPIGVVASLGNQSTRLQKPVHIEPWSHVLKQQDICFCGFTRTKVSLCAVNPKWGFSRPITSPDSRHLFGSRDVMFSHWATNPQARKNRSASNRGLNCLKSRM